MGTKYGPKDLAREARRAVKGKGRYVGWVLNLSSERGECFLWAMYKTVEGVEGYVAVAI